MKKELAIENEQLKTAISLHTYPENLQQVPEVTMEVTGFQTEDHIVVYQAYKKEIATYAQANQQLGGSHFSFNRMSWIKPNFLWMMYRSGWATKENQERILAISISKAFFYRILEEGVLSSYQSSAYPERELWQADLAKSEVRIQWDPEHDPYGGKQDWRVIQIGLKGNLLRELGTEQIHYIEDITDFVAEQKKQVDLHQLDKLLMPQETVFPISDLGLRKRLGMIR